MSDDSSSSSASSVELKKKEKEKKKRKREKKDKNDKKKDKKAKKKHKEEQKQKRPTKAVCTDFVGAPPVTLLDEDDYFAKSEEFRVWLHETKGQYLNEMESDKAHERFKDFVTAWNSGLLEKMFYDGIPADVLERCRRTRHKWKFKLSDNEKWDLATTKDSIGAATRRQNVELAQQAAAQASSSAPPAADKKPAPAAKRLSREDQRRADLNDRVRASQQGERDRNAALQEMIRQQTGGKKLTIAPRAPPPPPS